MIETFRSHQRGRSAFSWLRSQHSFSFGDYHDSRRMGFSALRVINDDEVAAGAGFDTHRHRNMEIISYVLSGEIRHRDSEGNVERLPAGEFQLMSAGSGISHSEYNGSSADPLRFLQVWIEPNVRDEQPGYQQKDFGLEPGLTLVASPDGSDSSLTIRQDARLYQLLLGPGDSAPLSLDAGRKLYVHVVDGPLEAANEVLKAGDGLQASEVEAMVFRAQDASVRALVFDLP
ncbi:hypothetical protein SAMN05216421_1556 [Halopseudomonas xinjiangensis]|uniref:Pirin N-terminal domain-containing protein n=1 Tax=Halopseudomonas xinjiangensis TaxID=487184 RepID=A0A1H1SCD4_9GAMM|nr:pirin family protein [Halopseudomonas xinjiangensis]SDS45468.1 hypothetical protein SAMN05216421_1556 [Halopseudomonas xinjiangensis]